MKTEPSLQAPQRRAPARPAAGQSRLRPVRSDGRWVAVAEVRDIWKINDEWWRGPGREIARLYFALTLDNGQALTVFHDLSSHEWQRQSG